MSNKTEAPPKDWSEAIERALVEREKKDDAAKDKRIEELEAGQAAAIEVLERIAHASDVYGVEANAEDYGADTLAYAHKSTCNLARATITELKGTD